MWADFAEVRVCRFRVLPISAKSAHERNRPTHWQFLPIVYVERIGCKHQSNCVNSFGGDSSGQIGFGHSLQPRHAD